MSDMNTDSKDRIFQHRALESAIRIGLIVLLVSWCFNIVKPFLMLTLWAAIIAVAAYPLFMKMQSRLGGRPKLAATLMTFIALAMLITPTIMLSDSAIKISQAFAKKLQEGTFTIPAPSDKVRNCTLNGHNLHEAWSLASTNLEAWMKKYKEQLTELGKSALSAAAKAGLDVPMPVILLGAIGGMILSGLIGLFVGAVVLSVGYTLYTAGLKEGLEPVEDPGTEEQTSTQEHPPQAG
jgi:predicted PurR-regulated permease PerM